MITGSENINRAGGFDEIIEDEEGVVGCHGEVAVGAGALNSFPDSKAGLRKLICGGEGKNGENEKE